MASFAIQNEGQMGEQEGDLSPIMQFDTGYTPRYVIEEIIEERKLTKEEASKCLNTLGKDESGVRYAYLMITAKDMKLTDISVVPNYNHLMFVDVSGNLLNLEALQVLCQIPYLLYIKAERNRLESAALKVIPYLQVLILNKNAVVETGDIHQPLLSVLELSDNQIYSVQFDPDRLETLKGLSLAGNHLLDTSGIYPRNIERLYLGRNKISKINTDFTQLQNLQLIHLRDNNIRKLSGFSSLLTNLCYVNVRKNKITKLRQFRKLSCLPRLETLILLENPLYTDEAELRGEGFTIDDDNRTEVPGEGGFVEQVDILRLRLLALLPTLKRINKIIVTQTERNMMEMNKQKLLEEVFEEESSEEETEAYTSEYTESELGSGHLVSEQTVVEEEGGDEEEENQ